MINDKKTVETALMKSAKRIDSVQNSHIKDVVRLTTSSRARREQKTIIIEGKREIAAALRSNLPLDNIFFREKIFPNLPQWLNQQKPSAKHPTLISVSERVMEKISLRGITEGLLATAPLPLESAWPLEIQSNLTFLLLEGIEKPGNLGAIIRTAEAAGIAGIFLTETQVEPYNPQAIRSSLGTVFSLPLWQTDNKTLANWAQQQKISIVVSTPQAQQIHTKYQRNGPALLIMGSEKEGVTDFWLTPRWDKIRIPMKGEHDSLNVSVAAGILMYELTMR